MKRIALISVLAALAIATFLLLDGADRTSNAATPSNPRASGSSTDTDSVQQRLSGDNRQPVTDLLASAGQSSVSVTVTGDAQFPLPPQRLWMRSGLWRDRVGWNDYPSLLSTPQDYAADPCFNPGNKELTESDAARLQDELLVWAGQIQDEKHAELLGVIDFLHRSWDRHDILFLPGSNELEEFKSRTTAGGVKFVEASVGGARDHPTLGDSNAVVIAVLPGDCPEVETAKENFWLLSVSANDSIMSFFEEL